MTVGNVPESQPTKPSLDTMPRRHGHMGLAISWERIPWWGIIILIVGVIVGYSVLTSTRYLDALYFIFDLPWNKEELGKVKIDEVGEWTLPIRIALKPRMYNLRAEYLDQAGNVVGCSDVYRVEIVADTTKQEVLSITEPSATPITILTTTPTIIGSSSPGVTAVIYDDFSNNILRILRRIWLSKGVFLTLRVTFMAFVGALILGLIFGLMRVASRSPNLAKKLGWRLLIGIGILFLLWVAVPAWRNLDSMIMATIAVEAIMFLLPAMPYTLSTLYVEVVRGIPMLVIVLYMGFAVTPAIRNSSQGWGFGEIDLRGLPAAIIGLAFGYGSYLAEVYRAGIESIHKGQMEAARSLGMSYFQAMRYVILPQAIRVVLPPLGNDFIAMLKDSSLISVIALPEILQQGRLWISRNFRAFEGFNSVALLYLIMTLFLSMLVRIIERRTSIE